jgi:NAD(P)-dependent dehydrogenase (short-subunit alcohol dehydrogenase family)
MELANTVALVTGGAGGLGEAAVRRLTERGAHVVIADLADERGEKLAADLGAQARYCRTDVLDDASVQAAIAAAQEAGDLRTVVIAHGGFGANGRIVARDGSPLGLDGWNKTISLYLTGTFNVLRLTAAAISATEPDADGQRGVVIATTSIAAYEGQIGQASYAAAKAGVAGLVLVAARDLSAVGVRVVGIAPGTMGTPIMESVGPERLAKFAENIPFPKRLGRPDEYGKLAVSIAENDYLNGEVIRLDGAQRFTPK